MAEQKGLLGGGGDPSLGQLAETITSSVLRAIAAREELRSHLSHDDSILIWEPVIRAGGKLVLAKGKIQQVLTMAAHESHG